ncbi:hypothetical protein PGB90_001224 [Kerria lacca]
MDVNVEQYVTIKFCQKAGFNATNTLEILTNVYSSSALKRTTVFGWFGRFCDGRESLYDDERPGHPVSTHFTENIAHVAIALKED